MLVYYCHPAHCFLLLQSFSPTWHLSQTSTCLCLFFPSCSSDRWNNLPSRHNRYYSVLAVLSGPLSVITPSCFLTLLYSIFLPVSANTCLHIGIHYLFSLLFHARPQQHCSSGASRAFLFFMALFSLSGEIFSHQLWAGIDRDSRGGRWRAFPALRPELRPSNADNRLPWGK